MEPKVGQFQKVLDEATTEKPPLEPVMPDIDDKRRQMATERKIASKYKKGGRISTVLTGAGSNKLG